MGCKVCRYEERSMESQMLAIDTLNSNANNNMNAVNMYSPCSNLVNPQEKKAFHNIAIVSKSPQVKLATDRGQHPRIITCKKLSQNCINSFGESRTFRKISKPNFIEESCEANIIKMKSIPSPKQPKKTLSSQKANGAEQKVEGFNASANSINSKSISYLSVAFDPGFLVVDNTNSISADYVKVGFLGRGTFGEVFKVRHKISNKFYAMKVIQKKCCQSNKNLINEIAILKSLVKIYNYFLGPSKYC